MKALRWIGWPVVVLALTVLPACSGKSEGPAGNRYGKFTLYDTKYDYVDLAKAKNNAADVLTQLGDQDKVCLIGLWAYNPPAILNAVKEAGKEGKVHIVGFDEYDDTLQGIKDGSIVATVVQNPYRFGYESVKLLAALARDSKAKLPADVKEGVWDIPHRTITKDKVDKFREELRDLKARAKGKVPEGDFEVAFVSNNAEEFWTFAEAGARVAAREAKVSVVFKKPKGGTVDEQKQIVDDLLTSGVKGIAISVNDPVNQKDFLNEVADKVPLITVDNDAPDTRRRCYIGTNNIKAGHEVG
ncbi:MAG TPA: substrate-binding domain-containing protein, partial [Gemmataceae bacterium]|nr:substrate-binding domain-containing protein [Gemmataceae bacterium]